MLLSPVVSVCTRPQRPRHAGEKPRDGGAGGGVCRRGRRGGHKRQEESSSGATTRRPPVSTSGLNSSPQGCERTYCCGLKPPDLWRLFLQPQETTRGVDEETRGPRMVLTGGAPRHLDDTLGLAAHLPRVEGADAHRHLHRGPGHLCGLCGSLTPSSGGSPSEQGRHLGEKGDMS